ncbi:hypothetical protein DEO72_LG3g3134 [Vigna unguiculata]|uniref:Uncharacterized protein n=1 Tax=Vigna unguiculata TaxID=3917 RepID=A0A4D6LJV4_VIGUN|nr:hypothetical protein DEO72_LG3g3134 [Vigna unguiculata]
MEVVNKPCVMCVRGSEGSAATSMCRSVRNAEEPTHLVSERRRPYTRPQPQMTKGCRACLLYTSSSLAGLRDAEGGPASFVGGATRNEENHGGCKQAMCDVCEGKRRISSNKYVSQCSQRRGTDPFSFWFLFCCLLEKANKPNQQCF